MVFRVIQRCEISSIDTFLNLDKLPLSEGDLVFISQIGFYSERGAFNDAKPCHMLTDIYYYTEEKSDEYDFIHLKDINIVEPMIYYQKGSISFQSSRFYEYLEDISASWNRNEIIDSIL